MAIGLAITAVEFDRVIGDICRRFDALAAQIEDVKSTLDTKTAAQWATDTGKVVGDVNIGMSAIADLAQVVNAYQGEIALAQADRRAFVRQARGLSSLV